MILGHKIALDPNCEQATYFAKGCGIARFAWNWGLAEWKKGREASETISEGGLRKRLNGIKRQEFPWMLEVTKVAPQQAIKNLGTAFSRFFAGESAYPQFKKKGIHDSFRADNGPGTFKVEGRRIKLPVIGWIKMRESCRFTGKALSATVSRVADRWFVSLAVDVEILPQASENQAACGVDLGITQLATVSDGTVYAPPQALRRHLKKLRRRSRRLSRKVKGSNNRRKARVKLARLHARIGNIRRDVLHKVTTDLVRRFGVIAIEDLNVRGMQANRHLARAIADVGMHEFKRQLVYKAELYGSHVVVADRWYPSSKLCSAPGCGLKRATLKLSERQWTCSGCGAVHDRDLNAAINIRKFATASSAGSCACGDWSSPAFGQPSQGSRSAKQESNDGINVHE